MILSIETAEAFSIGTESLESLGYKNEQELEEALIPLMQEMDPDDFMTT